MTDNLRGSIAYYAVVAGVMLTLGIAIGGAFVLVVLFAEWLIGAVLWLSERPNERDIVTIGVLALVALALAEWMRKP